MKHNRLVIDCERMKYPFTGLNEYCLRLSEVLYSRKDEIDAQLFFYTPLSAINFLGEHANYYLQQSFHKIYNPYIKKASVWHTTFQGSMYFPTSPNIKKILTIHDLNFLYDTEKNPNKIKRYLRILQNKIDHADIITVISQFTYNEVIKHLNTGSKRVEIIYNGCARLSEKTIIKPTFITSAKPFLFTIGTIAKKKNFHVLPALLKNNDFDLIISGVIQDKAYYQTILEEAKRNNVSQRVILTGPVSESDKYWLMKNAAFFLFPSISEGFGIPVVEAMSLGTPVITSTFTSLPEISGNEGF
jgi:glycosyltransferase involved in cell wall biosynthesis